MPADPNQIWNTIITEFGRATGKARYTGRSAAIEDGRVGVGAEFHPPTDDYRWHGLKRSTTIANSWLTFQWTLEGEGELEIGGKVYPQTTNNAFLVQVPSNHEYRIRKTGPGWKFFYVFVKSPWMAQRLLPAMHEMSYSFPVLPSSRLAIETLHLIEQAFAGILENRFEAEKSVLAWTVEVRRHAYHLRHPDDHGEGIIAQALQFYEENKGRSFGVQDFANFLGMNRTRVSTNFQKLTGQSPAAFFLELRLKDAISLLADGLKLQVIARETGFADANHFCKVFRRIYHVSPGEFRKMIAMKPTSKRKR